MTKFHLHLVSDATGETLNAVAKAAITQFAGAEPVTHVWSLIRSAKQLEKVVKGLDENPGVVLFTLVRPEFREQLEKACQLRKLPCVAVLDPVLSKLASYLGSESRGRPGLQHAMNEEYFSRIAAMDFSLAHDDGQSPAGLASADVVLVGVSRTSKTPTSVYLANRGVKAANVPIVPHQPLPAALEGLNSETAPVIVALTASPERLVQIRRNRLLELKESVEVPYADLEAVKEEVAWARRIYSDHSWPVIDVSRRSIEETAARILMLYDRRHGN